ncbi:MAG: polyketide synthase dehydratase domain-containing protein, partial [Cyanobacteria bacterium J06649_4]
GVYTSGCEIDWRIHNGQGKWVTLPNYPWQRERLWLENERATQERKAPIENPILGLQEAPATPAWRNDIDHESLQYLQDHVVTGVPILPAAAYIESLLELASLQAEQEATLIIRDLEIMAPMLISEDRGLDAVTLYDVFTRVATIRSLKNGSLGEGQLHITAKIANAANCTPKLIDIQKLSERATESIDIAEFYQQLDRLNLSYGKAFQTVREMQVSREHRQVLSRIEMEPALSENKQLDGYKIHPTVLDACFQTQIALLESLANTYLPTGFQEMCVYVSQVPERIWCICDLVEQTEQRIDCNLTLIDDEGHVLAVIRGMRSTAAGQQARTDRFGDPVKKQILTYEWSYGETLTEPKRLGYWLVVGAEAEITQQVCNRLENYGVIQAFPIVLDGNNAASLGQAQSYLQEHAELDGIVFLHGLSAMPTTADPTAETAVETLIAFSQALIQKNYERWPRVYAVTQAAFAVSETETTIYPGQSAINGFARVAFNELEGLRFSSIDLPAKLSEEAWDSLAMELLCDDSHDEVALRGTLRLVSELTDSSLLSEDRVHYTGLDDAHPIDVRPVRPDVESVGVSRILEKSTVPLEEGNIQLRVEATLAPYKLLLEASEADTVEPLIEVVGEVIAVGSEVKDLTPGTRVCGFAPVDVTSHYSGPREQFYLQPIASETDAVSLVSTLGLATRVQLAMSRIDLADIATAFVYANPLGLMLADELERQGVKVVLVSDAIDKLEFKVVDRYTIFPLSPEGLYEAKMQATQGLGFDLLVIPAQQWFQSFDLSVLRTGGSLVGTETTAYPLTVESHQVVRTDLKLYLQRPQRLIKSLAAAVQQFEQSLITPKRSLNVSVYDIAWQKLGLSSSVPNVALTFDTKGQDLPVVQADRSDFDTAGTYLITGGFGGFGQKTAEWLVQKGIRFLVLTGRSGANTPEKQAFVER